MLISFILLSGSEVVVALVTATRTSTRKSSAVAAEAEKSNAVLPNMTKSATNAGPLTVASAARVMTVENADLALMNAPETGIETKEKVGVGNPVDLTRARTAREANQ